MESLKPFDLVFTIGFALVFCFSAAIAVLRSTQEHAVARNEEEPVADDFKHVQNAQLQKHKNRLLGTSLCTCVILLGIPIYLFLQKTVTSVKVVGGTAIAASFLYALLLISCQTSATTFRKCKIVFWLQVYIMVVSLSFFAIGKIQDESHYYHGPAPIMSYATSNRNYQKKALSATITVGYGGRWACPDEQKYNDWCESKLELSPCGYYDKTGWAGQTYENVEPTWKMLDGEEDMWEGRFSCDKGMEDLSSGRNYYGNYQYNGNDDAADDDAADDDAAYDDAAVDDVAVDDAQDEGKNSYLYDPDDSPYRINVFIDCKLAKYAKPCTNNIYVDTPRFRDKHFFVPSFMYLMLSSSVTAVLFLYLSTVYGKQAREIALRGAEHVLMA